MGNSQQLDGAVSGYGSVRTSRNNACYANNPDDAHHTNDTDNTYHGKAPAGGG